MGVMTFKAFSNIVFEKLALAKVRDKGGRHLIYVYQCVSTPGWTFRLTVLQKA